MEIGKIRSFLLQRGMAAFYAVFVAGYFLLPMASGHRRLYYVLVFPAVLLLWRELRDFYRGNPIAKWLLVYIFYMTASALWSEAFDFTQAGWTAWYSINLLSFCFVSGFLWWHSPAVMGNLTRAAVWLAAASALISLLAWYWQNPFPTSRLEPLGVMHHPNKAACAYGVFLVLATYFGLNSQARKTRIVWAAVTGVLLCLVLLTQSRTALAAVGAALVVLLGYRALIILLIGGGASFALLASSPQTWQHRVANFSFRPGIWEQVIKDMPGHWIAGHGYLLDPHVAAYERVFNHAHNGYLATLRDGGLIGLALLLALLLLCARQAWSMAYRNGERIYLALLLYGMTCITMDFDRLIVHPKELWLFFWLPIALLMAATAARDTTLSAVGTTRSARK
tara:strand:+ start:41834 stop:43015 length:1182 start_codon:yes stop_codon:yes gene_type:complete